MKHRFVRSTQYLAAWRDDGSKRRILAAAMHTALMVGLVKLAVLLRDLVVAWEFGTADAIDAFFVALLMPAAVTNIVVGAFAAALIPAFIRIRTAMGATASARLAENFLALGCVLLVILMILLALLGPSLLRLLAGSFAPEKLALTQSMLWMLVPLVLLQGLSAMWGALINTGKRFALVALTPAATPLLTLSLLFIYGRSLGIWALVIGFVVGAVAEAALLALLAARNALPVLPRWHGYDERTADVVRQFGPFVCGAVLMSGALFVDQAMAALLEPGSVAALNYGGKLSALLAGLAVLPLSTAVLPYFAETAAKQLARELRAILMGLVRLTLAVSIPATLLLALLSQPIVAFVFQRGAFNVADTQLVAQVQALYVLQTPFYIVGVLGVRMLSVLGLNHIVMRIAVVNFMLNIVLNLALMRLIGLPGIALATSIVYAGSAALIYASLLPRLRVPAPDPP